MKKHRSERAPDYSRIIGITAFQKLLFLTLLHQNKNILMIQKVAPASSITLLADLEGTHFEREGDGVFPLSQYPR